MTALLDVNVLIALAWPNHVHHAAARAWFKERQEDGWATCPLTEAGFVRVSCNPAVVRHQVTVLDAITVLNGLTQVGKPCVLAAGSVNSAPAKIDWCPSPGLPSGHGRRIAGRCNATRRRAGNS